LQDLTQSALAAKSGVTAITISRIEHGGAAKAHAATVYALAKALRVSADYLLGLSDDDTIQSQADTEEDDAPARLAAVG
jgi:transcriptional regulator with XRE-family HTH domain